MEKHEKIINISVLGDSVSTLEGFNPDNCKLFYEGETARQAGVLTPGDTWWGRLIEAIPGGRLLVNNSWSGSRVTKLPFCPVLYPSACSDERTGGLHSGDVLPDVIIVAMGINDWGFGVPLQNEQQNYFGFETAYRLMLQKLTANYPRAEVWCLGISPFCQRKNGRTVLVDTIGGVSCAAFNRVIGKAAREYGCLFLHEDGFFLPAEETLDGTHPNSGGMKRIAENLLRLLRKEIPELFEGEIN